MSTAYASAIHQLEHELAGLDEKRDQIQRALDTLRPLAGLGPLDLDTPSRTPSLDRRRGGTRRTPERRAAKNDRQTDRQTEQGAGQHDTLQEPP